MEIRIREGIEIDLRELPEDARRLLEAEFTYKNPQRQTLQAIKPKGWQFAIRSVPEWDMTWFERKGTLVLPRGGLKRVRAILDGLRVDFDEVDEREEGEGELDCTYRRKLYPYQAKAVREMVAREQGILRAGTGCLSGDTSIAVNRGGKGFSIRLDALVHMQNGGKNQGRAWDMSIPTMIRARKDDGSIGLIRLLDAFPSGVREVWEVKTECGRTIRATLSHRFFTETGWKRLGTIGVGSRVWVESSSRPTKTGIRKKKSWYFLSHVPHHPYAGRKSISKTTGRGTVPTHRLVAEARLNGMPFDEFINRVRRNELNGLEFLDPKLFAVHHLDENAHNNAEENLVVLTHLEHNAVHREAALKSIAIRPKLTQITAIRLVGKEPTFDLSCDAPNNFIANGFVVHNSGKTSILIATAAEIRVPTIAVMNSSALAAQWSERVKDELGFYPGQIGGGKMEIRPFTLAIEKTLALRLADPVLGPKLKRYFGCVLVDECQASAAGIFQKCLKMLPARFRFGASADQRRKDGRHYLIHDLFGEVLVDIPKEQLVNSGHVMDVEVIAVPTEFEASWYGIAREGHEELRMDFVKLCQDMSKDVEREMLALRVVAHEVKGGTQMLVMCHEREHARRLAQAIGRIGISSGILLGGDQDRAEFERALEGLRNGSLQVGVGTYKAVGTGLDIPRLESALAVTPIAANEQFFSQVMGRVCRIAEGKRSARLWVLWDQHVHKSHWKNIQRWNENSRVMPI